MIKLADILCTKDLYTGPDSPEYKILDFLLDDDEIEVLSHMSRLRISAGTVRRFRQRRSSATASSVPTQLTWAEKMGFI